MKPPRPVRFTVKVVPRAGKSGIRGRMTDGTVKIALRSPPVDGKANEELIRFIAGEFGVPASSVSIVSGMSSRRKLMMVEDSDGLPEWLR